MCDLNIDFYRGCRNGDHVDRSELPLKPRTKSFYPDIRKPQTEDNTVLTSIHWNDDDQSLCFLVNQESKKENWGIIAHGISFVEHKETAKLLSDNNLTEKAKFDHLPDPENYNPYHGNIRFDIDFCTTREGSNLKYNKINLNRICNCFVLAQYEFINSSDFDRYIDNKKADNNPRQNIQV